MVEVALLVAVGVPVAEAMGEREEPLKVAEMIVPSVEEARGERDMV